MLRRWILFWGVLAALVAALPVGAQAEMWTAWLYDSVSGRVAEVDSAGAILNDLILPLPAGFDRYPTRAAVGPDGETFAYIGFNSVTYQGILVVSRLSQTVFTFALPLTFSDNLEFVADESVFSPDGTQIAIGYSLNGGGWSILAFDLQSGGLINLLSWDAGTVAVLGLPATFGITPVIRAFDGQTVTFNLIPAGTEALPPFAAYDWNVFNNSLTSNSVYQSLDADRLPATGEVIMSLSDDRLQNQSQNFQFGQLNSLQVYDVVNGARYPFFNAPDYSLFTPRFIQGGQYIVTDGVDFADRYQMMVLTRDGRLVTTLPAALRYRELRGTSAGFVYTTDDPEGRVLLMSALPDGAGGYSTRPVWASAPGDIPMLVWVGEDGPRGQTAFTPWAQLAAPVFASGVAPLVMPAPNQPLLVSPAQAAPASVPTPAFNRPLVIGGLAIVNTTEGDQLNVRLGPGRDFDIAIRLSSGERVTIVDGPRAGDGLVWWKVRTAVGIEGWAVESVDDNGVPLQTLLPS